MSQKKMGHILPIENAAKIEQELMQEIANIFRQEYKDIYSAVKQISRKTNIPIETVKRWNKGRNPPSSGHLIILAHSYSAVLQMILKLAGRPDLAEACLLQGNAPTESAENDIRSDVTENDGAKNCTINVTISLNTAGKLNQRQLWFLGMLQQGHIVKAEHITSTWSVSLRTAKYDIAAMTEARLIKFVGSKGAGRYKVLSS